MTNKFDNLIKSYYSNLVQLIEQDEPIPAEEPMGDAGAVPTDSSENKVVSTGYAYLVNIIYMLLKYNTDDIDPKYYKLSDNKATNANEAFRYIDILTKLLPESMVSDLKNDTFDVIDDLPQDQIIQLDDPTATEMANIAIKCLFFSPKDNAEFSGKIEDIQDTLAQSENKLNIKNANAVYQQIKDFISLSS